MGHQSGTLEISASAASYYTFEVGAEVSLRDPRDGKKDYPSIFAHYLRWWFGSVGLELPAA